MLRRYPTTLRWRQALPPLFVLSLLALGVVSVFFPPAALIFLGEVIVYVSVFLIAGFHAAWRHRNPGFIFGLPLVIPVMHIMWGSGLLWSMLISGFGKNG